MAGKAGTAFVEFVGDFAKIQRQTKEQSKETEKTFGQSFKRVAKNAAIAFGGIFAARKLIEFGKASVDAASDQAETINKVKVVLGDASDAVLQWSKDSAKSLGQSRTEALDAAASFSIFGKSAGLTGPALAGFSTDLVGLTADMASFSNTTPQDAIEAVNAALRGEAEPIRKYGVLLNDATLKTRALKLGLIKTTKEALTPQNRVLAAQAEIFAQTKDAQGDFSRTSDGLANQQRILSARFKDAQASLGTLLLPIIVKATTAFASLAGFLVDNQDAVIAITAVLGPLVVAIGALLIIDKIKKAFVALNLVMAANPAVAIALAIAALGAAIFIAYKKFGPFHDAVDRVWQLLQSTFHWIQKNWPLLLAILTGPFGLAVRFIIQNWDGIVTFFKKIPARLKGAFKGMFDGIKDAFKAAINFVIDTWNKLQFKIGGQKVFGKHLPSVTIGTPDIPRLHEGGIVPGTGDVLALLQGGESVFTPEQAAARGVDARTIVMGNVYGDAHLQRIFADHDDKLALTLAAG